MLSTQLGIPDALPKSSSKAAAVPLAATSSSASHAKIAGMPALGFPKRAPARGNGHATDNGMVGLASDCRRNGKFGG